MIKKPLAGEQNNYLSSIVSAYIVYDLDASSWYPTSNFKFKNCLYNCLLTFNSVIFGDWSSHPDSHKNNFLVLGNLGDNPIDKSDRLNIHKYLMTKNNIRSYLA